jgi:nanoRNase/pAp phosphatase (c-di-AMP/oligoRNAs hydrolase)
MTAAWGVGQLPNRVPVPDSVDPEVLAAGVAAALVLFGVGAWLARRRRRGPADRFRAALAGEDAVAVLTHPNPDPDAMASAMAAATLAEAAGATPTVRYPGEVRHHQNRAFRTVLDVEMSSVEDAADLADAVVLVDHNEPRGFTGAEAVDPLAVVDHHPGDGRGRRFTDVRPEYGACATVFAEYLRAVDGEDADDADVTPRLATGLLFGILADTDYLTDGPVDAEFEAASYLYPRVDREDLQRVRHPQVDAESLEVKARAVDERDVRPPFAVSDVGEVGNVDAIPQAADELVNLDAVTAVVVFGDDGETLHLSGRSRDDRVHVGDVVGQVAEAVPLGSGGGHARMGGGQLRLEHMSGLGPGSGMTRDQLRERLFAAMRGEEPETPSSR